MLIIRLSRQGRTKKPFFRVVLTEHTKPVQAGFKEVLGWYDPFKHILEVDTTAISSWVAQGAQLSERVAKLIYNQTKDESFKKFVVMRERTRKSKKDEEVAA